ncbi:Fanconi anemia group J protein [Lobulomyces angularis]|nr:Fanconi anemia group J protein [Lobulomyces angularis]
MQSNLPTLNVEKIQFKPDVNDKGKILETTLNAVEEVVRNEADFCKVEQQVQSLAPLCSPKRTDSKKRNLPFTNVDQYKVKKLSQGILNPASLGWIETKNFQCEDSELKKERFTFNYTVSGIKICFPFKVAYSSQMAIMSKTIKAISEGKNAILESPTGSGKTLALLVSTLAWVNEEKSKQISRMKTNEMSSFEVKIYNKENNFQSTATSEMDHIPKIFYTSRTTKQIYQVIKELKQNTIYRPKMSLLASRDFLCVHPQISLTSSKNEHCAELCKLNKCTYKSGVKSLLSHPRFADGKIWDIEDINLQGKASKGCPYFTAREIAKTADIIFCPYNYITEPTIRESLGIDLTNNIVIFDEAHNIEDACISAASTTFSEQQLSEGILDLKNLIEGNGPLVNEYVEVISMLQSIMDWILRKAEGPFTYKEYEQSRNLYAGNKIIQELTTMSIFQRNFLQFENLVQVIAQEKQNSPLNPPFAVVNDSTLVTLNNLSRALKYIFQDREYDFRMVFTKSRNYNSSVPYPYVHTLGFWCLNPGVIFTEIKELARSIILTSGTLTPMGSFSGELNCKFDIKLEVAPHVIEPEQVLISGIVSENGYDFIGTYKNVDTFEYQDNLGNCLLKIISNVPNGQNGKAMENYCGDFENDLKEYEKLINSGAGAMMICVHRGKLSEGIDFSDNLCRAVIVVGIPFPSVKDLQVNQKKSYNDQNVHKGVLSGSDWYETQAFRALNQALGRCIRHKEDWGCIFFIDKRFSQQKYLNSISKWVKQNIKVLNDLEKDINQFIKSRLSSEVISDTIQEVQDSNVILSVDCNLGARKQEELLNLGNSLVSPFSTPRKSRIDFRINSNESIMKSKDGQNIRLLTSFFKTSPISQIKTAEPQSFSLSCSTPVKISEPVNNNNVCNSFETEKKVSKFFNKKTKGQLLKISSRISIYCKNCENYLFEIKAQFNEKNHHNQDLFHVSDLKFPKQYGESISKIVEGTHNFAKPFEIQQYFQFTKDDVISNFTKPISAENQFLNSFSSIEDSLVYEILKCGNCQLNSLG